MILYANARSRRIPEPSRAYSTQAQEWANPELLMTVLAIADALVNAPPDADRDASQRHRPARKSGVSRYVYIYLMSELHYFMYLSGLERVRWRRSGRRWRSSERWARWRRSSTSRGPRLPAGVSIEPFVFEIGWNRSRALDCGEFSRMTRTPCFIVGTIDRPNRILEMTEIPSKETQIDTVCWVAGRGLCCWSCSRNSPATSRTAAQRTRTTARATDRTRRLSHNASAVRVSQSFTQQTAREVVFQARARERGRELASLSLSLDTVHF